MENNVEEILLSVVICTHCRPESLSMTLCSLANMDFLASVPFELIVVENDTRPSKEVLDTVNIYTDILPIRLLFATPPNLSIARNLGAEMAKGVYISYLDDDVEVCKSWLQEIVVGILEYSPDIFCGPSFPLFRNKRPKWFQNEFEEANIYGLINCSLSSTQNISGMNFGIKKELYKKVGGFSPYLGMRGNTIAYGEETLFVKRAWKIYPHLNVTYFANASVMHEVRSDKLKMWFYIISAYAHGRDAIKIATYNSSKKPSITRSIYYLSKLIISGLKFITLLFIGYMFWKNDYLWNCIGKELRRVSSSLCSLIYNFGLLFMKKSL